MKTRLVFVIMVCFFSSAVLSVLFPSILSTKPDAYKSVYALANLNDAYEDEIENLDIKISKIHPEKLNWFTTVCNMFEKFSDVRVVDCKTLKEYNVRRVGGYNHADVECLTKDDAYILKSLYGGVWSWERRPVWVEINGTWVAASINAMPHSYQYIEGNDEDGHTCIHFFMSKTHGTKRVDEAHQQAVEYAANNGDILRQYLANKKEKY